MAKKNIDAKLLKVETERLWDEYDGKELSERNEGAIEAIDRIESFIDSLQQEQSCDTCTNDKGCVTCKDGELWEGEEQSYEDLEEEIKRYEANLPESATVDPFEGYPTLKDIARHFYELGKQAKKEEV